MVLHIKWCWIVGRKKVGRLRKNFKGGWKQDMKDKGMITGRKNEGMKDK